MAKYQGKYRIESARAQWWDYGWNGAYFVTICTRGRQHYFGHIAENRQVYSPVAAIADLLWHEIPQRHPYIELGEFVVMPNHVHGVLLIGRPPEKPDLPHDDRLIDYIPWVDMERLWATGTDGWDDNDSDSGSGSVETGYALSLPPPPDQPIPPGHPDRNDSRTPGQKRFQNPGKHTLSTIVGGYKSAVSKHARRMGFKFGWQARFHDRIIRDAQEFARIARYIRDNPKNWMDDRFFGR